MNNPTQIIMPIAIALIMFGIGINLKFRDFRRVFLQPKAILIGLGGQFLLLPLIAFIMAWLLPIEPLYKVGFILIASVPGGTASNLVTHMLKGRVALSVSLTSFNSFGILLSIPLYLSLAIELFLHEHPSQISIGFADTFKEILLTVVLPVIAGIIVNEYGPHRSIELLRRPLRWALPILLFIVFSFALFFEGNGPKVSLLDNLNLYLPLLFFNVLTMFIGFYLARFAGIRHDGAFTIAIEMGLQNSALAILIATSILHSAQMSLVAIIYGSFTFFSTWLIAWFMKHRLKQDLPIIL
jgi:BASS family bile acid:Na+ symporter